MKINTLFLNAFGPFTKKILDFSGSADLHLIYGENEAGKSSALRAMSDLRFEIPKNTKDNFVHDHPDLKIAACFENHLGLQIGLLRKKGQQNTLLFCDPKTGEALDNQGDAALFFYKNAYNNLYNNLHQIEHDLKAGLDRAQFENMYGLNSARLREGGEALIQGQDALSAVLFEANSGSSSTKILLETLEQDAKKYFISRGQNAQINIALKQLQEAKQAFKQASIKPDQWKQRKQTHEKAQVDLEKKRAELEEAHQESKKISEWKTIASLLQEFDSVESLWNGLSKHISLPKNAPELRSSVEPTQSQARITLEETKAALAIAKDQQTQNQAFLDEKLLHHATTIEQFDKEYLRVLNEHEEHHQLKIQIEQDFHVLKEEALRWLRFTQNHLNLNNSDYFNIINYLNDLDEKKLHELFLQLPSEAQKNELEQLLNDWKENKKNLLQNQIQQQNIKANLNSLKNESYTFPDFQKQEKLEMIIEEAQLLGDISKRFTELNQNTQQAHFQLMQSLKKLDFENTEQLQQSRWIPLSEVHYFEQDIQEKENHLSILKSTIQKITFDLNQQEERFQKLISKGEEISAKTLENARQNRQMIWQNLKENFGIILKNNSKDDLNFKIIVDFERAQFEADRQADLLREGAERAAEIAECRLRIQEMQTALSELKIEENQLQNDLNQKQSEWKNHLIDLHLPISSIMRLREWLQIRENALIQLSQFQNNQQEENQWKNQVVSVYQNLFKILSEISHLHIENKINSNEINSNKINSNNLNHFNDLLFSFSSLLKQSTDLQKKYVEEKIAFQKQQEEIQKLEQEILLYQGQSSDFVSKKESLENHLKKACQAIYLPSDIDFEIIQIQLRDLQKWQLKYQIYQQHIHQLEKMDFRLNQLVLFANNLLIQLRDSQFIQRNKYNLEHDSNHQINFNHFSSLTSFLDQLKKSLNAAQQANQQQIHLIREIEKEENRQKRAQIDLEKATEILSKLMKEAEVFNLEDLKIAEENSQKKQNAYLRFKQLENQLIQITSKSPNELKQSIQYQNIHLLEEQKQISEQRINQLKQEERQAIEIEQIAQNHLNEIDDSDKAAFAREEMEQAIARYKNAVRPWAQLKLAHALLNSAQRRYQDKTQAPVLQRASIYFKIMTSNRFDQLKINDEGDNPVLMAQINQAQNLNRLNDLNNQNENEAPQENAKSKSEKKQAKALKTIDNLREIAIKNLSEGTMDQLYLSLRLAALELQRLPEKMMPLILDDIFITSDDHRAACIFRALAQFAKPENNHHLNHHQQIFIFTHHAHLLDIAKNNVDSSMLKIHYLNF